MKTKVPAPIDKSNYSITGFFYEANNYKFRKFLNIRLNDSGLTNPDIMIIMMNPGGSVPVDGNENSQVETLTKPDKTQDQIIRIMENSSFKYARVINLSDLREAKSHKFYSKIKPFKDQEIPHSIFDESRNDDFEKYFEKNVPVIYAWGVNTKLVPLAKKAMKMTKESNSHGFKKPKYDFAYYHPLPRGYKKQITWVEELSSSFI